MGRTTVNTVNKQMGKFQRISFEELMALLEKQRKDPETAENWGPKDGETNDLYIELMNQISYRPYKGASKVTLVTGGEKKDMVREVCRKKGRVPTTIYFDQPHSCVIETDGFGSLHVIIDNKLCPTSL